MCFPLRVPAPACACPLACLIPLLVCNAASVNRCSLSLHTLHATPCTDPAALAALMADHTVLDWRPLLPRITLPCLNLVGRQSAVFPW